LEHTPYIELKDVSKYYDKFKAVDKLSLRVNKGDIYGFLGPNGAGKSTSIRMILSLIRPSAGTIKLFDKNLVENRYQTLSRIGALIEKSDFYNYLSARKNLHILGRISEVPNLAGRIDEVLDIVGLSQRATTKVKAYSQGMKQRLGIAQALLHKPDLLILDEPANGLDPQGQMEMRDLIVSLNQDHGMTILLSSHLLHEIEQIANRMVIINKGKTIVEGRVHELLHDGELKVSFEVSDPTKASELLNKDGHKAEISSSDDKHIVLELSKELIPLITKKLTDNNIEVFEIRTLRSLEEYFLNLTQA
jgi:ABC-type multidrug transport system ATPase subunit